ncbi:hypothetical protein GOP47_0000109 [Adiantum capillus-veneris]|uniref:Uncharacterized protein n=1 Tax=Adiantum capillus-veneris TaxID=13818 RepID=A0A9D4VCE7_ADICA|nr:hypothetical protein GOP47_0000109 [Adiantum capillus-veneris]
MAASSEEQAASLKEQGNSLFKAGNFLKAAALYTQAIKADPSNATLYSNRSAAFLSLLKVTKALADAEMTIQLKPTWEKGYFRKGCVLEAMDRLDEALAAYKEALQQNPQSSEVATKIKRLSQLIRDKKRTQDKLAAKGIAKGDKCLNLDSLKADLASKVINDKIVENIYKFIKDLFESAVKDWCEKSGKLDARVYFYTEKRKEITEETVPIVAVDKAFESPDTLSSCVSFLRQHVLDTSSVAACLIVPKQSISFPQVWKGQGSRKWKHSQSDGFFLQLELSAFRRIWFIPCGSENGQPVCRNAEPLDIDAHAVIAPLFR